MEIFIILILGLRYRGEIMKENKTVEEVREYKDKNHKTLVWARNRIEKPEHFYLPFPFTTYISNYKFLTIRVNTPIWNVEKYIINPVKFYLEKVLLNKLSIAYVYEIKGYYRINIYINE